MRLSAFDKSCLSLLDQSAQSHSRHCFRSAINHLKKSKELISLDQEMAAFRCITAEEEAASGLMHVLKEKKYENADKLKQRDHVHKNAVIPFFGILGTFFQETLRFQGVKPTFHIREETGKSLLMIRIPMVVGGEEVLAYPVPPLNFMITSDDRRVSYKRQIATFVAAQGARDISTHLREQANVRNRLLYAGPEGYPIISEIKEEFFTNRQKRIFALLKAYLLIVPYKEHQPFVQDALDAFLAMLGILETHDLHDEV